MKIKCVHTDRINLNFANDLNIWFNSLEIERFCTLTAIMKNHRVIVSDKIKTLLGIPTTPTNYRHSFREIFIQSNILIKSTSLTVPALVCPLFINCIIQSIHASLLKMDNRTIKVLQLHSLLSFVFRFPSRVCSHNNKLVIECNSSGQHLI